MYGKRLKDLIDRTDMNQKEFAKKAKMSEATLSLLINDERKFFQDSFTLVLETLGMTPEEFFLEGCGPGAADPEIRQMYNDLDTIIKSGNGGVVEAIKSNLGEFARSVDKDKKIIELEKKLEAAIERFSLVEEAVFGKKSESSSKI